MTYRVAIAQLSLESNHFVARACDLEHFRATGYILEGDEVLTLAGRDNEIAGMLEVLRGAVDVEIVPVLTARANSSGVLAADDFARLTADMLARLRKAGRIDALLISCHGSMAAQGEDDPEGSLATQVRGMIGPCAPLVMTLDLHGNVTARMVEACDMILAYETYPHEDATATGRRAASLLLRQLRGEIAPAMSQVRLPMILTAFNASTRAGPFAELMHMAKALEGHERILSTSLSLVGSYLDVPELGCSAIVIVDGDAAVARRCSQVLADAFWARRQEFVVPTVSVAEAVGRGRQLPEGGPVLLLDTADTTGGGASGDSIAVVKGLIEAGVTEPCLATVVDPIAAARCQSVEIGATIALALGHAMDPRWGEPLLVDAKVVRLIGGAFRYRGGILGGCAASMGPSAVVAIGSIMLLVTTHPTYEYATEQYEAAGLDPRSARFVVVKNIMNFRVGYCDMMKGSFVLDCPGPTPSDMRALPFTRIPRPIFPIDAIAADPPLVQTMHRSVAHPPEGYFQRVAQHTATEFWINNPTPEEAEAALAFGAVGATTNPTYSTRLLKDSVAFRGEVARLAEREDDETVLRQAYVGAIARLQRIFAPLHAASAGRFGYVAVQGDPRINHDAERMIAEALRLRALGDNIIVKVPATSAGAIALEELTRRGIPTIATLGFSLDQAIFMAEAYRRAMPSANPPRCYITVIAGILDEHLVREATVAGLAIPPDVLRQAGIACTRIAYRLFKQRGYEALLMGGGARGTRHFSELLGGELAITIGFALAEEMRAGDAALVDRIATDIPGASALEALPSYGRACRPGSLAPNEFADFPPVAEFQRVFLAGIDSALRAIAATRTMSGRVHDAANV